MRFVAVISVQQREVLTLHTGGDLVVGQRKMSLNKLGGYRAKYAIVTALGAGDARTCLKPLHEEQGRSPAHARLAHHHIAAQVSR